MPGCWFSFLWLLCKIGKTIQLFMFSHRLISGTKTLEEINCFDFIFFYVLWFADNTIGNYIMGDSTDSLLKAKDEDASYSEQIGHWFWKINTLPCSNRESDWQHVIGVDQRSDAGKHLFLREAIRAFPKVICFLVKRQ